MFRLIIVAILLIYTVIALIWSYLPFLRKGQQVRYLGHDQRDGWLEPLAIYGFKCENCQTYQESHNMGKRDKLRLFCYNCNKATRYGFHNVIGDSHKKRPYDRGP